MSLLSNLEEILMRVEESIFEHNQGWPDADFEKYARDAVSPVRSKEQWDRLINLGELPSMKGLKLLEIGSGFGSFLVHASQSGLYAVGLESDKERALISRSLLALNKQKNDSIVGGFGEHLPFPTNTFDIVYSANVIEHVISPSEVFGETLRVLKPGGVLQFVVPNYGSWWEGHYAIIWLPNLPKKLARIYVRLLGRNPDQLNELRLINRASLERIIASYQPGIEVLGWGQQIWEERVLTLDFNTWAALNKLIPVMKWIHRLGLAKLVVWLGRRLHWETPIILTVRKKRVVSS